MRSFTLICLVYHATTKFCRDNFDHRSDPLGKTVGQMVGAARSARQNIVEGSCRAAVTPEQEPLQYDVAKGSLAELAGDFEAFILDAGEAPWSESDARMKEVVDLGVDDFNDTEDVPHRHGLFILEMRKRFSPWLENESPLIAAQAILITIRRAVGMLTNQIKGLHAVQLQGENAPVCPECGSPMRKITARKGPHAGRPFWSCSRYPDCKGARSIDGAAGTQDFRTQG